MQGRCVLVADCLQDARAHTTASSRMAVYVLTYDVRTCMVYILRTYISMYFESLCCLFAEGMHACDYERGLPSLPTNVCLTYLS